MLGFPLTRSFGHAVFMGSLSSEFPALLTEVDMDFRSMSLLLATIMLSGCGVFGSPGAPSYPFSVRCAALAGVFINRMDPTYKDGSKLIANAITLKAQAVAAANQQATALGKDAEDVEIEIMNLGTMTTAKLNESKDENYRILIEEINTCYRKFP
ncbi:hypothetical protein [Sandaracinobacteroides saxicola]|uniref:Uncharacterized protein n=1 Tax=Sandaracinobacteroides saxicola TaxID=2759707 RepID=A0A7G5IFJ6_9SPHN|nr:hypothetical protein [Sandaracinobacteroides saxicola]QMW22138.1 hypothetical protein H3309_12280 [Sandaracinobacteroides saxicola]